jgi:hypothetical protein
LNATTGRFADVLTPEQLFLEAGTIPGTQTPDLQTAVAAGLIP